MEKLDARGKICPEPVIMAKKAMENKNTDGLRILVDDEICVENLKKLAKEKKYKFQSNKIGNDFEVILGEGNFSIENNIEKSNKIIVISSNKMGEGDDELGKTLLKTFLYTLTECDKFPSTIIFYNSGVFFTCENSTSVGDLKSLETKGVKILSCGACLNFYDLTKKIAVGGVTNMYEIATLMLSNEVIKP